jgi:hypothetical protein
MLCYRSVKNRFYLPVFISKDLKINILCNEKGYGVQIRGEYLSLLFSFDALLTETLHRFQREITKQYEYHGSTFIEHG